jgi:RimJ/RimL family protein N-acetyltransferase
MMQKNEIRLTHPDFIIRSLRESDLQWRVDWFNDPQVSQTLIVNETIELEKTKAWFQKNQGNTSRLDCFIEDHDARPIGLVGLRQISADNHSACVYIVIGDKSYWGRGVMYSSHMLLLDYAFQELKLHKIWCNVLQYNIASCITLKKIGFQIDGLLRDEFLRDGRFYSVYRMSILSEEFNRIPEKSQPNKS